MQKQTCPCGKGIKYEECCGIIHKDIHKAITAEDLMRSRYTAYVLADGDYLMQSHHSKTRPLSEKKEIVDWAKSVNWVNLKILEKSENRVKFNATYQQEGELYHIIEDSVFEKENKHWVYLGEFKARK